MSLPSCPSFRTATARSILKGTLSVRENIHLKPGFKVTDLISSFDNLLPEPADRAEIVRLHPPDFSPMVIPFNLR